MCLQRWGSLVPNLYEFPQRKIFSTSECFWAALMVRIIVFLSGYPLFLFFWLFRCPVTLCVPLYHSLEIVSLITSTPIERFVFNVFKRPWRYLTFFYVKNLAILVRSHYFWFMIVSVTALISRWFRVFMLGFQAWEINRISNYTEVALYLWVQLMDGFLRFMLLGVYNFKPWFWIRRPFRIKTISRRWLFYIITSSAF